MAYETLLLDIVDGVATLTLNRPEAMNAITQRLKDELGAALTALEADPAVRVLVLTGAGEKAFCAGADIKERSGTEPTPAEFFARQQATHRLFTRIEQFSRPVVVALNGVAFGGGAEIALCADIRIAADTAGFGLTEVNLGVIPAGGGTQRLPRLVGAAKAKELIFTGARLKAPEALALGLVNRVVPAAELRDATRELARSIAAKPPLAVRFAKQAIDKGLQADLQTAMDFELYAAAILFDTEDRKEGMRAFVEKRAPVFTGR
ncbi:MAG TPA: enoyl-CoA hydratase-related protein [Ramlibacter sp.]|nr:enoyl-CoA hydratase-related protein [Ramlibacter sp.]